MAVEHIIELSALDFGGKSTQADLLTYGNYSFVHNFGGFGDYGDSIPRGLDHYEDWNWWFKDTTFQQFGGAVIEAYNTRTSSASQSSYDIAVTERGASMVKAQLTANFATRNEIEVFSLVEKVEDYAKSEMVLSDVPKTEIYLEPDQVYESMVSKFRGLTRNLITAKTEFSPHQTDFYEAYQKNLSEALEHFASIDRLGRITVDSSAIDVNNQIRNFESLTDLQLPELLSPLNRYVGLSGLSESGKSKIAEVLASDHGFTRFKLGFFNELVRDEQPSGPPVEIAKKIAQFLIENKHIKRASFESFHGPQLAAELKLLLGKRWLTVFVDSKEVTRQQRLLDQFPGVNPEYLLAEQALKDEVKNEAGVLDNKDIADIVIDNNGSLDESIRFLLDEVTL